MRYQQSLCFWSIPELFLAAVNQNPSKLTSKLQIPFLQEVWYITIFFTYLILFEIPYRSLTKCCSKISASTHNILEVHLT